MDDLISRKAALNAIDCWHIDFNSMDGAKVQTDCWRTIKELPAVDAVPVVHGQWVDEKGNPVPWCDALPSSPAYSCWCNQCETWLVASDEYPVYGLFCPACGAKMDGERRDENADNRR